MRPIDFLHYLLRNRGEKIALSDVIDFVNLYHFHAFDFSHAFEFSSFSSEKTKKFLYFPSEFCVHGSYLQLKHVEYGEKEPSEVEHLIDMGSIMGSFLIKDILMMVIENQDQIPTSPPFYDVKDNKNWYSVILFQKLSTK